MRWGPALLLGVPVLLFAGGMIHARKQSAATTEGLLAPADISWTVNGRPAAVDMVLERDGEIDRYRITVSSGERPLRELAFTIDHDMYGGGFVGGLDVDGDGEQELVLANRGGPSASRLVEPGPGGILDRRFQELPDAYWQEIEPRLAGAGINGSMLFTLLAPIAWFIAGCGIYAAMGLWSLLGRLRSR